MPTIPWKQNCAVNGFCRGPGRVRYLKKWTTPKRRKYVLAKSINVETLSNGSVAREDASLCHGDVRCRTTVWPLHFFPRMICSWDFTCGHKVSHLPDCYKPWQAGVGSLHLALHRTLWDSWNKALHRARASSHLSRMLFSAFLRLLSDLRIAAQMFLLSSYPWHSSTSELSGHSCTICEFAS